MKSLEEFITESLKAKFTKIDGNAKLAVKSKEYGVDYKVECGNWYAGWNDSIVAFWSPDCDWIVYFFISEPHVIALMGMDRAVDDPATICKWAVDNYRSYAMDYATVPEVDSITFENPDIEKIAKKYGAKI